MHTKHLLILAGWGAAVASLMTTLDGWQHLADIKVVGSIVGSLCAQVLAMYADAPTRGKHDA